VSASDPARGVPLGAQAALAAAAGLAMFAVVAVILAATDSLAVAIGLGVVCLAAVVGTMRLWGAPGAVPVAIAALVAYDWFAFPPTHREALPGPGDLAALLAYVSVAAFVGVLAEQARRRAVASEVARGALLDEQAALRRVATLVAHDEAPHVVFAAIAEEVGRLLGATDAQMYRYEHDGTAHVLAHWRRGAGGGGDDPAPGARVALPADGIPARVRRSRRPVRRAGAVGAPVVAGRLWGVVVVTARRAGGLPPGTEQRVTGFTELAGAAIANTQARCELASSRARIVAAADEERRRVVRDLHDGAQQHLVHTIVMLKLALRALGKGDDGATTRVAEALAQAEVANRELRELAHGILPRVLTRDGLPAAVEALTSRVPVPVDVDVVAERLAPGVEATAYFVIAEALTNVAKHARARRAAVTARTDRGRLRVEVRDDGVGSAQPDGTGLVGLADRVAVLQGELRVESPAGGGTVVAATVPLVSS
jgi:signal transduction histidine kinase